MALVSIIEILVEYELAFVSAVDSVVGEVHEHIIHVLLRRCLVAFRTEASKALLKQVYSQWVHRENEDIQPAVELEVVNQQGILDVLLDYIVVLWV